MINCILKTHSFCFINIFLIEDVCFVAVNNIILANRTFDREIVAFNLRFQIQSKAFNMKNAFAAIKGQIIDYSFIKALQANLAFKFFEAFLIILIQYLVNALSIAKFILEVPFFFFLLHLHVQTFFLFLFMLPQKFTIMFD